MSAYANNRPNVSVDNVNYSSTNRFSTGPNDGNGTVRLTYGPERGAVELCANGGHVCREYGFVPNLIKCRQWFNVLTRRAPGRRTLAGPRYSGPFSTAEHIFAREIAERRHYDAIITGIPRNHREQFPTPARPAAQGTARGRARSSTHGTENETSAPPPFALPS